MRVAFATSATLPDGIPDDHPAAALLGAEYRVWNDPAVDWTVFHRVVIRSIWDYTDDRDGFLAWCARVGPARLRNVPELIAFNTDKRYLAALDAPTVATAFIGPGDPLPTLDPVEVVVKPNISAGARLTGRFTPARHADALALIDEIRSSGRTAMVQPYLASVDAEGETALVFIGGVLSHVLAKQPVLVSEGIAPPADGHNAPAAIMFEKDLVIPGRAADDQVALAEVVIAEITARFGSTPLYARVDLVRGAAGEPLLLELEATEPCLYLLVAGEAASARFADAVRAS